MNNNIVAEITGLSFDDAIRRITAVDLTYRIRQYEGEYQFGDCTVKHDRVNLYVKDDKIEKASIG